MVYITLLLTTLCASAEPAPGDLVGKVVDAAGKSIPGATVFIYTAKPRMGRGILCPSCYADCQKKATTGSDGKYHISKLNPTLLFKVLSVAEGYRPQFAKDVDPYTGSLDIKLEAMPTDLSNRAVLRGRVIDDDGKPVVGAIVKTWGCKTRERRWWGRMPGVDPVAVTNLRGEFLITGNKGDLGYDLKVESRGHAKRLVDLLPTGKKTHDVRVCDGAVVEGRLLKGGKPVAGITVGLMQCDRSARTFVGEYRIATNGEGRFTFANVHPNDNYYIYTTMGDAARIGGILLPKRISVGGDNKTEDVGDMALDSKVYKISGRVILSDGKTVPSGTRLMLSREDAWDSQRVVVADDGSFSFAGVPEEAITLNARIKGYRLDSSRNRFQQVQSWAVAMFVDADRSDIEVFFKSVADK